MILISCFVFVLMFLFGLCKECLDNVVKGKITILKGVVIMGYYFFGFDKFNLSCSGGKNL